MEQLYSGLRSIGGDAHYTLEIAVAEGSDDIVFYVAVPTSGADLFEKQILSLFPHAHVTEEKNDYNIFVEGGASAVAVAGLKRHPVYPLRMFTDFEHDPLKVLLNAFSKIEREGGGASVQFLVRPRTGSYQHTYEEIIKKVGKGVSVDKAIETSTAFGEMFSFVKDELLAQKKKEDEKQEPKIVPQDKIERFRKKIERPIYEVLVRVVASARDQSRALQILREIESSFHQYADAGGNELRFTHLARSAEKRELRDFAFREWNNKHTLPLSERELATLIHIPEGSASLSPQYKQTRAISAPAPLDLPQEGTHLGTNTHRNVTTEAYVTPEDRLRHFYIIGQTGTGKTTLMKNMIMQDIVSGAGVCYIDPHGSDIADILAQVPKSRMKDVIYFDPSNLDTVLGLNMLEYDPKFPEQKTFVINELFSIFQKLYGANPESMGPMFEQYFRNATALVLEDPESGSTLLDVSRVMVDSAYRRLKLSKAKNPVVIQFWREIATKAGGDAALENIVPYITSKFDVFTANDYMRPLIGQQHSAFNFRELMDERKILLVNLAKGRLGEINANLIGMIIVGKILMAALSRSDAPGKAFAPFYLHIDEFQNITTNSIAAILSEARKYKLGLTLAHQYIEQIDEKIRDAVFGNVGSLAVFRVGPDDANYLETQFLPTFTKNDLLYIPNHHAYVRILAHGTPTKPFDIKTIHPPKGNPARAVELIVGSQMRHGRPRDEVEAEISARYQRPL
jgi:tRNA isopentenyl-2-thiomethyl-A-37 hydroxylase MiaE